MAQWLKVCSRLLVIALMTAELVQPVVAQSRSIVTIAAPVLSAGDTGTVEARIDCGSTQCSLFAITLKFDPTQLQVNDVELGLYLGSLTDGLAMIAENVVDNDLGEIRLAATSLGMPQPPKNDVLFRVNVTALTMGIPHFDVTRLDIGDQSANPVSALTIIETIVEPTNAPTASTAVVPALVVTRLVTAEPVRAPLATRTPSAHVLSYAIVNTQYGDTLNLRERTSTNASILEELPIGAVVSVIGGPVDQGGFRWWNLLSPTGVIGWAVESADGVTTLQFSSNLTPSLVVGTATDPPRFRYGQRLYGLASGDIWTRPDPDHGRVIEQLSRSMEVEVSGMVFAGHLLNGTLTWWYLVRVPGEIEARGWMTEHQLAER